MTLTIPEAASALGNVKLTFLPAYADLEELTTTELNGVSAVKADVFMLPDWAGLTGNQNKGTRRRFAEKVGRDALGILARALEDVTYTYLPQAAGSDPANKMKTALTMGATGAWVIGYDKDPADAWAEDDIYTAIEVECGYQRKNPTGADEFAELTITQALGIVGNTVEDVPVVAP